MDLQSILITVQRYQCAALREGAGPGPDLSRDARLRMVPRGILRRRGTAGRVRHRARVDGIADSRQPFTGGGRGGGDAVDPALRRGATGRTALAACRRRGEARRGDPGVHPVPAPRPEPHARRADAPLLRGARLRKPARRPARFRRLVGTARGRVHPAGVGGWRRGARLDRRPALVQGIRGHDRPLLGRVRRAPDRGAPPARAQGDHHRRLHRRPLPRRHALHRRVPHRRSDGVGHRVPVLPGPAPRSGGGRRRVAADVARPARARASARAPVAAPPVARRVLAARLGRRGLRRHRSRGLRGRGMGRRLLERGVQNDGAPRRATPGHGGPVGSPLPPRGSPGPRGRLPAGRAALVGALARRRGQRRHGRAGLPAVDAGVGAPLALPCRASRPLGGHGRVAARGRRGGRIPPLPRRPRRGARGGGAPANLVAPDPGARGRRVVRKGLPDRRARRPARGRRVLALLRQRAPGGAFRGARRSGRRPGRRFRPAGGARGDSPERRRSRRQLATGFLRGAEPDPSRRARIAGAAGPRRTMRGPRDSGRHRPRLCARTPNPHRDIDLVLASRLAGAGSRHPGGSLRREHPDSAAPRGVFGRAAAGALRGAGAGAGDESRSPPAGALHAHHGGGRRHR